jgi:hypothetical protein
MAQGLEKRREFVRDAAGQFGEASRGFVEDSAAKPDSLLRFAGCAHGGPENLQGFLAGLVEGVVRTNLRLAQELLLVESPGAFIELQQRFMREYFDAFQHGADALIRITNRFRNEALT